MGLRFRKSIKIAPGVKLNIGSKSVGVSLGGKFAGISVNSRTGAQVRASAPGTGLSYTRKIGGRKKKNAACDREPEEREAAQREPAAAEAELCGLEAELRAEAEAELRAEMKAELKEQLRAKLRAQMGLEAEPAETVDAPAEDIRWQEEFPEE